MRTNNLLLRRLLLAFLALSLLAAGCSDSADDAADGESTEVVGDDAEDSGAGDGDAEGGDVEDGDVDSADEDAGGGGGVFPVSVDHTFGVTEVPAMPERVVSASATMTGHLLNVEIPVVAAQVLPTGSPLADDAGFLRQWADVASSAGVEPIPGPEINVEAIAAADPDLIIGTSFGQDAITDELYGLLSEIAPTIAIDSSGMDWQELAVVLGDATGHASDAQSAIEEFDATVADAAGQLDTTSPVVPAVVSGEGGINVLAPASTHGRLLESLGYSTVDIEGSDQVGEAGQGSRSDVVSVSPENIVDAFGDASLLWVFATEDQVPGLIDAYPTLGALPSVVEGRDVALGVESFRIDRYSADLVIERLLAAQG